MKYLLSSLLLLSVLLAASCKKVLSPEEQLQADKDKIKEYLTSKNLTATERPSGLHYIITTEGSGEKPTLNNSVTVRYKGYLLDGTVFDQTQGTQTRAFDLRRLISSWQEGIPLLKKGGKGTFLVPSYLGYGSQGSGGLIPPNAVLIFEIELVDFR
jgi:FKBP-type peptidyl-prolyl cis-trans isomerase FkpA